MMIILYILDQQELHICFINMESVLMNHTILMYESFNIFIFLNDKLFFKFIYIFLTESNGINKNMYT